MRAGDDSQRIPPAPVEPAGLLLCGGLPGTRVRLERVCAWRPATSCGHRDSVWRATSGNQCHNRDAEPARLPAPESGTPGCAARVALSLLNGGCPASLLQKGCSNTGCRMDARMAAVKRLQEFSKEQWNFVSHRIESHWGPKQIDRVPKACWRPLENLNEDMHASQQLD